MAALIRETFHYHDLLSNKFRLRMNRSIDGDVHLVFRNKRVKIPEVGIVDRDEGIVYLLNIMCVPWFDTDESLTIEYETSGGEDG